MKTVNLDLVGINSSAFSILGTFQRQAKKEHWTETEIKDVLNEAMSGNYNHLLGTITKYCIPVDENEFDEENKYNDEDENEFDEENEYDDEDEYSDDDDNYLRT